VKEIVCVICGCSIDIHRELVVPTTTGEHVHVVCADRESAQAFAQRQQYALVHVSCILAVAVVGWILGVSGSIVSGILVWTAVHSFVHWRWWQHIVLRLQLHLQRRMRTEC
jgi:hypothetical protein